MEFTPDLANTRRAMLPKSLAALSDLIGIPATLKLALRYPSVAIYIPRTAKAEHPVAKEIGLKLFKKMVEYYDGETIKIAKLDTLYRQLKHQEAKRLHMKGCSNKEIALHLKYSQRHIERILREG